MRCAQPRRRRHDALANAGRIDADDRRILEDPRARPSRQIRKAVEISAAVDLKCPGIIHAMEIALGPELGADAVDLPAFHLGLEILAEHLQPADQLIAASTLETSRAPSLSAMPGINCSVAVARTNSAPAFDSDQSSRASSRPMRAINSPIEDRSRHHSAELMPDAFQPTCRPSRTATLAPSVRLQRHGEAQARSDHADIESNEREREPAAFRRLSFAGVLVEISVMRCLTNPLKACHLIRKKACTLIHELETSLEANLEASLEAILRIEITPCPFDAAASRQDRE